MLYALVTIYLSLSILAPDEWICWTTSISDVSCGTYGIAKSRETALRSATELCNSHCNAPCKLDYCERMEK